MLEYNICIGIMEGRKIYMYYSEMVKKAVNIMFEAHKEDFDKGGYPYVFHPFYLATKVDGENETCVALLHDVIEDHGDKYSFEYLENEGFNKEIIDALKLLTHKKDVPYMDYIVEISKNNIAKKVKIEDLKHNMDSRRTSGEKAKKYDIYVEALEFLEKGIL